MPERFEFGTLPYEQLAGATAAVDFMAAIAPGDAAGPAVYTSDDVERLLSGIRSFVSTEGCGLTGLLGAGNTALSADLRR